MMADDLVLRLRGEYRIPITDGLGPAGGSEPNNANEFVRHFPTPPIQKEAAARIETLEAALRPFAEAANDYRPDHPDVAFTDMNLTVGDLRRAREAIGE